MDPIIADLLGRNIEKYISTGDKIKDWRRRRDYTLGDLSEKSGVSVSYLSRIENNKRELTLDTFAAIAQALDVQTIDLLPGLANIPVIGSIGPKGSVLFSDKPQFPAISARFSSGSFPFALQVVDTEIGQMLNGYYVYFNGVISDVEHELARDAVREVTGIIFWEERLSIFRTAGKSEKGPNLYDYHAWNERPVFGSRSKPCVPVQAIVPPDRVQVEGTWERDGGILPYWQNID